MPKANRPLSPHLQVYRWQITSVLSILHRFTGVALAFGALLLAYWLTSAAYGPEEFARAHRLFSSWFGRLVLLGLTFSLFYHLANGIRHLAWDVGLGYGLPTLRTSGWVVAVVSVVLTSVFWVAAFWRAVVG